jgi:RimJ/RimL family protein N-acetyltransferase
MISLRDVEDADLDRFFEHWNDADARHMAAFVPADASDRAAFDARWERHRRDPSITLLTIDVDGTPAGSISSWDNDGGREVTYWLGRRYWGKGIATEALRAFLEIERTRPLFAATAADNIGSQRVLARCGFEVVGRGRGFSPSREEDVDEVLLRLD